MYFRPDWGSSHKWSDTVLNLPARKPMTPILSLLEETRLKLKKIKWVKERLMKFMGLNRPISIRIQKE